MTTSYVPDTNMFGMLSDLGKSIASGVQQYQQKQLLSDLGQRLMRGDYNGAAQRALQAGDMATGLKLMELGKQQQDETTFAPWTGGSGLSRPTQGASPTKATSASSAPIGGFDNAVNRTLFFEGGLNKRDTNGTPSNFGINAQANPDVNVLGLTKDGAKQIYKDRYWDEIDGDKLQAKSPALAHVAFDTAVIAGPAKANDLVEQSGGDPNKLLDLRKQFQDSLIRSNPQKYGPYAEAWNNRIVALRADVGATAAAPSSQGGVQVADASGGIPPMHIIQKMIASSNPGFKAMGDAYLKRYFEANPAEKWTPLTDPAARAAAGISTDDTRAFLRSSSGDLKPIDEPKEQKDKLQKLGTDATGREIYGTYKDGKVIVPEIPGMGKLSGADGSAPLQGEEYLKSLDPQTGSAVKAITEGRMSATGRRLQQLMTMAAQYDPGFDQQRYNERLTMQKSMASSTLQSFGGQLKSANQAISHANEAYDLVDKLGNYTKAPGIMNRLHQGYASQFDPQYQDTLARFRTSISAVSSELGKVFTGNAPALETLRHWRESMSELDSPVAIKAGISEAMKLLHGGVSAISDRYNQVMGTQKDASEFLTPQARDAFDKIAAGKVPAAGPQPPKIGEVVQGYRFKGGDPGKQENWFKMGGL